MYAVWTYLLCHQVYSRYAIYYRCMYHMVWPVSVSAVA
jgi:hypothetical protein